MTDSIQKRIQELQGESNKNLDEVHRLERLLQRFPDLRHHVGRWNKEVACSKTVNPQVTHYETRYNCGCCPDSPLEMWPYLEIEGLRVYSDPPCIQIGERSEYGDRPYSGWKDRLRKEGIPEAIIEKVKYHFRKEAEEAREVLESAIESSLAMAEVDTDD